MGLDLKDRKTDEWGNVIFSIDGLLENLMRGNSLGNLVADASPEVQQFNQLCREFDHIEDAIVPYVEPTISVKEFDQQHQSEWFIPEPYASLDVLSYLLERCSTDQQVERVNLEWTLFTERGMEQVLRFLIYMIDNFRERKILWGVGRGSSVASYCLFLIGVHRIDSLLFDLDPYEFLKK